MSFLAGAFEKDRNLYHSNTPKKFEELSTTGALEAHCGYYHIFSHVFQDH